MPNCNMSTKGPVAFIITEMTEFSNNLTYPGREWSRLSPPSVGFDLALLEEALNFAGEHRSQAVVVLYEGQIVAERYWQDWDMNSAGPIYSATKSFLSFLYGIALKDGLFDSLSQSVVDFLPEWSGDPEKEKIQIKHLLGMNSGLECSFNIDFVESKKADNDFDFSLGLNVKEKLGETWAYNNTAYRLLFTILERASKRSLEDYFRDQLVLPLGFENTHWGSRPTAVAKNPNFIHMSCRDLARFGLLIQGGGSWEGEALLQRSFLEECFQASQTDNPAYGLLWWLNSSTQWKIPYKPKAIEGSIFPDCPSDTVAALGFKDNKVYIVPSLGLVVARMGDTALKVPLGQKTADLTMSGFDNPFLSQICRSLGKI
jgi:CubicO group peptidase (beta-lactamase class C family)